MKVCILTSAHSPYDDRIVKKQAKTLVENGMEVTLIAPKVNNCPSKEYNYMGIKVKTLPLSRHLWDSSGSGKFVRFVRFVSIILIFFKAINEKVDAYHLHDPELLLVGYLLKVFTDSKVIYDVHEYYYLGILSKLWIPERKRKFIADCFYKLEKRVCQKLDGVITIDDNMSKEYINHSKNLVSIYNYVESNFLMNLNESISNLSKQGCNDEKNVLYIGDIKKDRGLEIILKSMQIVASKYKGNVNCYVIGALDIDGLSQDVKENFEDLKVAGNIIFTGEIERNIIPNYLAKASICLIPWLETPNQMRGRPIKLYEYMASRKPLVVSDFGIISQVVKEARCGLVAKSGNYEDFAEKILMLLENEDLSRKLGENGYNTVTKLYTWEKEIPKLINFYKKLQLT